jgi:hypothetical protein
MTSLSFWFVCQLTIDVENWFQEVAAVNLDLDRSIILHFGIHVMTTKQVSISYLSFWYTDDIVFRLSLIVVRDWTGLYTAVYVSNTVYKIL